jgi:hypothetical protein
MNIEPTTLSWFGAWGQICIIVPGVVFWTLGMVNGVLAACVGYFIVTQVGIIGIAKTESAFDGAIMLPFIVPGFVPLYYFATQ